MEKEEEEREKGYFGSGGGGGGFLSSIFSSGSGPEAGFLLRRGTAKKTSIPAYVQIHCLFRKCRCCVAGILGHGGGRQERGRMPTYGLTGSSYSAIHVVLGRVLSKLLL